MVTAGARTNSAGYSVSDIDVAHNGHVEAFRIDTSGRRGVWDPEEKFARSDDTKGWDCLRGLMLGDLLSSDSEWGLVARYMQESGINLRQRVQLMLYQREGKGPVREVWTPGYRYKAIRRRVYGHRRASR